MKIQLFFLPALAVTSMHIDNNGINQNNMNNIIVGKGAKITGKITNSFSAGPGSSAITTGSEEAGNKFGSEIEKLEDSTSTTVNAEPTSTEAAGNKFEEMQSEIKNLKEETEKKMESLKTQIESLRSELNIPATTTSDPATSSPGIDDQVLPKGGPDPEGLTDNDKKSFKFLL